MHAVFYMPVLEFGQKKGRFNPLDVKYLLEVSSEILS